MPTLHRRLISGASLGVLAAVVGLAIPGSPEQLAAAPPAVALPPELACVPADAALFLHVDVAAIWNSDLLKTLREAEKKPFTRLEALVSHAFGEKLDNLKSLTLFLPKFKQPGDLQQFGVALRLKSKPDRKKMETRFAQVVPNKAKLKVLEPAEKVVVLLVGLGAEYGKPQPTPAEGHLSAAIRVAATGKHALVAGATFGNLPDELQKDDLPGLLRAYQPLFRSQVAYATLDIGKTLTFNVRAKTTREATAVEVEKSLAAGVKLVTGEIAGELPNLEKVAAKDAGVKDLVTVLQAILTAGKRARFGIDGTEARLTVTLPLAGLPLVSAYKNGVIKAEEAAAVQTSSNNLKQIALAMHNYADANNQFPPAAVCNRKGMPQLSWRVLILPYIEQNELYKQFKLDEPWDSAHNKKLIAKMPDVYRLPGDDRGSTKTYYRVFVGNGAAFDWVMGMRFPAAFPDGTSNTIMVATGPEAVTWTKPEELEYDPAKDPTKLFGMVVNGKTQAAFCDGSVHTRAKLPSKKSLRQFIERADGEVITEDF